MGPLHVQSQNNAALEFAIHDTERAVRRWLRRAEDKHIKRHSSRVRRFVRQYKSLLRQIDHGLEKSKAFHVGRYVNSHAAKVIATMCAFDKRRRWPPLGQLESYAKKLDCWNGTIEPLHVLWRVQLGSKTMLICVSGRKRTAMQLMIRDALHALGIRSDVDFAQKGRGGERALFAGICEAIEDDYRYWSTPDVTNCFLSLRPGHFQELPINERLIFNVAFLPEGTRVKVHFRGSDMGEIKAAVVKKFTHMVPSSPMGTPTISITSKVVRRNLVPGSVLSPLLASWFIAKAVRDSIGDMDLSLQTWVDDLMIGGRHKSEAEEAESKLFEHLATLPAGPVGLHGLGVVDNYHLSALGYDVFPPRPGRPKMHVKPGDKRIARFKTRLKKRLEHAVATGDDVWAAEEKYALAWFNSQSAWTKIPAYSENVCLSISCTYVSDFLDGIPMGTQKLNNPAGSSITH